MPRDLTNDIIDPAIQPPTITHIGLDNVSVQLVRATDLNVIANRTVVAVTFGLYAANGSLQRSVSLERLGNQLPAAVVNAYRTFHNSLLAAAQAAGVIPPGVDTQDI